MKLHFSHNLIFIACILVSTHVFGQGSQSPSNEPELPTIFPPSPTVANLMSFEEVPVSTYSGQPEIGVPLFSKKLWEGTAMNLQLSYNTQGVKINNRSSWTGTGWSLMAGGSISRTVRGIPDERPQNSPAKGTGVLHNDQFWIFNTLTGQQKNEFKWRCSGTLLHKYDYEPDLFQYNVMGMSGRFVIIKEQGVPKPVSLSTDNIKIELDYGTGGGNAFSLNSFTLIDSNGIKYEFNQQENLLYSPITASKFQDNTDNINNPGVNISITTSWHLTTIKSPNDIVLATLTYQDSNEAYEASISRTEARIKNPPPSWNDLLLNPYNSKVLPAKKSYTRQIISGTTKKLQRIDFMDSSYIVFSLSGKITHPETDGGVLASVSINTANNTEYKKINFNYNPDYTNRLWLDGLEEVFGTESLDYLFVYKDKLSLPAYDSVSDQWGYNVSNSQSNCGLVVPDGSAIQKGILESITYPTGGKKEFVFERHSISYQGNQTLSDDEYRDLNPDNWIPQSAQYAFDSQNNTSNDFGTFTITQPQYIRFKRLSATGDPEDLFDSMIRLTGPSNYVNPIRLDEEEIEIYLELSGTYEFRFVTLNSQIDPVTATVCFGYKSFTPNVSRFIYGGGVRIKEILFTDSNELKKFRYEYGDNSSSYSGGSVDGFLTGEQRNYEKNVTELLIPDGCPAAISTTLRFNYTTKGVNIELTKGQYVGYKYVHVIQENNGWNEYIYTSPRDYYNPSSVFDYPYTPALDLDFKRGLLLSNTTFNQSGNKVREVSNLNASGTPNYEFISDEITKSYRFYDLDCPWRSFYETYSQFQSGSQVYDLLACGSLCAQDCIGTYENCGGDAPFYFLSDNLNRNWARLIETTTTDYFYNGSIPVLVSTKKNYVYDDSNYQVKEEHFYTNIDGGNDHYTTLYFYPVSSLPSSYVGQNQADRLVDLNRVTEVLVTQQFKNGSKLSESQTEFFEFSPNLVMPKIIKSSKGNDTPTNRIQYFDYDNYGNPIDLARTEGIRISYIWGYSGQYPVAKIENKNYNALPQSLVSQIKITTDQTTLIGQLEQLRTSGSLSDALVTTMTYKPLVGVSSATDPKGDIQYFMYDVFGRLIQIEDKNGNILQENEYRYRTEN